jgi:TIR domain/Tetratricopeptide repeat
MANTSNHRDFFISFNAADIAYAEALNTALEGAGFTTFYYPANLPPGGNIAIWMDDALLNSSQTLALYSPEYIKDEAVYSKAERYASWWQDPTGDKRKLIPILLRETTFTPLVANISRIEVVGLAPTEAAARVVERLKAPVEAQVRDAWRTGSPLPQMFRVPYRPNPNFTGRFEDLESLQQCLRTGTNAAVTAVGGTGKTTLVAEYCHRFGGRYGGVWWIRAEQEPVMLSDLEALGDRLGIIAAGTVEENARKTLDHLATLTQPWLLIYDNAPNPDGVQKWLPTGAVRYLITSRFTELSVVARVVPLDRWSDYVTAEYILSRTGRDDKSGAERLARRLGGLPLAAEQAAVYLGPRPGITFDDYTADIAAFIKRQRSPGTVGDYPDTVYVAFLKSLQTLEASEDGTLAIDLLRICAFLSPDGVDVDLLTLRSSLNCFPPGLSAAMADQIRREDILATLASRSLLKRGVGPAGNILIFHRLLLEVVRDLMGEEERPPYGTAALLLVYNVLPVTQSGRAPHVDTSVWPLCARIVPHIGPLEAYATTAATVPLLGVLLHYMSFYLTVRGDRNGALAMAERSVIIARLSAAEHPLLLAIRLNQLGGRYRDLNRLDEAEAAYRESLSLQESHRGDESELSTLLTNLGGVLLKRKQFVEAESLRLRALQLSSKTHGTKSADYGVILHNLAVLYEEWAQVPGEENRNAKAQKYYKQALSLTLDAHGPRHQTTAQCYKSLSVMKHRRPQSAQGSTGC